MKIENNKECFVRLWRLLERTRQYLESQRKRFCVRRILQTWFGENGSDDLIWEVCNLLSTEEETVYGWDELPTVVEDPKRHRFLLQAIVAAKLGIGLYRISSKELREAYSVAFPKRTPIQRGRRMWKAKARGEEDPRY